MRPAGRLTLGSSRADTCPVRPHAQRHVALLATLLSLLLAVLLPAQALACPIAIRRIGPLDLEHADIRRPVLRTVTRAAWGLDASWASTRPRLSQVVVTTRSGTWYNVSYRRQQALSIDARGPFDNGWMYVDDADPDTPPCAMVGEIEWQAPRILVRQTARSVRVAAVSRRTVGDRTGCVLGPDLGVRECPNLTRTIVKLSIPLGSRPLIFEAFP